MKRQYIIPQVATLPVFNATVLCASTTTPTDSFTIGGEMDPETAY